MMNRFSFITLLLLVLFIGAVYADDTHQVDEAASQLVTQHVAVGSLPADSQRCFAAGVTVYAMVTQLRAGMKAEDIKSAIGSKSDSAIDTLLRVAGAWKATPHELSILVYTGCILSKGGLIETGAKQ